MDLLTKNWKGRSRSYELRFEFQPQLVQSNPGIQGNPLFGPCAVEKYHKIGKNHGNLKSRKNVNQLQTVAKKSNFGPRCRPKTKLKAGFMIFRTGSSKLMRKKIKLVLRMTMNSLGPRNWTCGVVFRLIMNPGIQGNPLFCPGSRQTKPMTV